MTKRKTPDPQQAVLFEAPSPLPDLMPANPKVTFSRVLMPYFMNLKGERYTDINDRMVRAVAFKNFLPFLLPSLSSTALPRHEKSLVVSGVALNSGEYQRLARWPGAIQRNTRNNSQRAHALDADTERRSERADRSVKEDFKRRIPAMQKVVRGIEGDRAVIAGLTKEARTPGYAHVNLLTMRSWAIQARTFIFQNVLDVVGREKEWSREQTDLAARSLDVALYFDTTNRLANYREALDVSDTYAHERERLFNGRIAQAGRIVISLAVGQTETPSV